MTDKTVITSGGIEKIGLPDSFIKVKLRGKKIQIDTPVAEHTAGVQLIFKCLTEGQTAVLKSLDEIDAVGHRMVHGGEKFNQSVLLDDEVMRVFTSCNDLAPLHNPANIKGVNAVKACLPGVPQVGVFDTAFHQTMPDYAYMYALPYELYTKYGVRRYGFHGTSHRYVSQRVCEYLGISPNGKRIITCHIGNGGSITAIKDGKSIDTSMGLTPLEGLVMGTRCGDIDPATVTYLMETKGWSTAEVNNVMNKKSGLLGLSGGYSDMRDVLARIKEGDKQAQTAYDVFIYRVKKYIGSYVGVLGGLDVLVFTGGMGENEEPVRRDICKGLECLGVEIDDRKNDELPHGGEGEISAQGSKSKIWVIPTDEEYMIALDTLNLVTKK